MIKDNSKLKPQEFESKWQRIWEQKRLYQPDLINPKNPYYNLMMFPYPSAEGLHVGNMYAFTGVDIHGRFMRMRGYDVFEPIGLDGFGIHSENYAIKIGKNPAVQAKISEENFYRQLRAIGNGFAFENHLETYNPDYYRWTQWLFIQMFKHGLAYRKKSPVNFCPSCKTVLSDEQVIDGKCERCKSEVEKKQMEQWFFKITKYAEKLLQNTYSKDFNWTEKVRVGQRNWIGKKEGIFINYPIIQLSNKPITNQYETIECFTTRPDTNFGATFVVIGPEHDLALSLLDNPKIKEYVEKTKTASENDRIAAGRKKTGVFTGYYAVNQLNDYQMPIYISDFVLGHVGTGAVVGVPGHDLRDFEFAQTFNLPIIRVVVGKDGDKSPITKPEQVQEEEGRMINSEFLDGLDIHTATVKMMDYLEEKGMGKRVVTYKLRDWCISRQRYWGAPIPMIFCKSCAEKGIGDSIKYIGKEKNISLSPKYQSLNTVSMPGWFPVSKDQLPVLLPQDVKDWQPEGTGKGPLANIKSFLKTQCPNCGGEADRETDVCDTFLDSSWYFLRYPFVEKEQRSKNKKQKDLKPKETILKTELMVHMIDNPKSNYYEEKKGNHIGLGGPEKFVSENSILPWNSEILNKWLPVHSYIGGAEHTVLHLLYARFVTMSLNDFGLLDFEEPFKRFYAHGLIIAEGAKMSKSRGNVVIPDEYINKYGADTLRTYLMFLGPFDMGGDFRDTGIAGMYRFLNRVWRLITDFKEQRIKNKKQESDKDTSGVARRDSPDGGGTESLTRFMHRTIKEVTEDLENLRYNTAIAHIMEFVNVLTDHPQHITQNDIKSLLLLLAPFTPHMTEELWSRIKNQESRYKNIHNSKFIIHNSIHLHPWPCYDPTMLVEDDVVLVVQINGKMRDTVNIQYPISNIQKEVEKIVKNTEKVKKYLHGQTIRKTVFIPGKLINFVI